MDNKNIESNTPFQQLVQLKQEVGHYTDVQYIPEADFKKTDIESKITDHKFNMSKFKDELISLKDKDTSSDFDHLKQIITDFQRQEKEK